MKKIIEHCRKLLIRGYYNFKHRFIKDCDCLRIQKIYCPTCTKYERSPEYLTRTDEEKKYVEDILRDICSCRVVDVPLSER